MYYKLNFLWIKLILIKYLEYINLFKVLMLNLNYKILNGTIILQ